MSKQHERFGNYYGVMTPWNPSLHFANMDLQETETFMKSLKDVGVVEIYLDIDDDNDWSSTLYFTTDENTDYKTLMVIITKQRPDEFSEESSCAFRMWFD
jgi:hypothetical protein